MLRFKEHTGKEITQIDPSSLTDLYTYLWCCVAAGAKREGRQFEMSLMDFADALTPEEMAEWNKAISAESADVSDAEGEKKSL